MNAVWFAAIVASYALGCLNAAYYWVLLTHATDIRLAGSGNAGARNAGRVYGWCDFVIVFGLDALKAVFAVCAGLWLAGQASPLAGVCALAVVIGHVWPLQLRGRGGKGLASAIGAVLALLAAPTPSSLSLAAVGLTPLLLFTHRRNIAAYWRADRRTTP